MAEPPDLFIADGGPCQVHVDPAASGGTGTLADPFGSVMAAVAAASAGQAICLAEGTFDEEVSVTVGGVTLLGGWCSGFGMQDPGGCSTTIRSPSGLGLGVSDADGVRLEDLILESANATPEVFSSHGVRVVRSTGVVLERIDILVGDGQPGAAGDPGVQPADGSIGGTGEDGPDAFSGAAGGGAPGASPCAPGGEGGIGGTPTAQPTAGDPGSGGATGGPAGANRTFDTDAQPGEAGGDGSNGTNGDGGIGGASFGSLAANGTYVPAEGADGMDGTHGGGGGGGGGGGYGIVSG
ncbi:MAG: hypothetical protein GWN25_23765, partial [Actinobacteria bacterium]|nr:hypothetical protein [Actinomycetota bacterium]